VKSSNFEGDVNCLASFKNSLRSGKAKLERTGRSRFRHKGRLGDRYIRD